MVFFLGLVYILGMMLFIPTMIKGAVEANANLIVATLVCLFAVLLWPISVPFLAIMGRIMKGRKEKK